MSNTAVCGMQCNFMPVFLNLLFTSIQECMWFVCVSVRYFINAMFGNSFQLVVQERGLTNLLQRELPRRTVVSLLVMMSQVRDSGEMDSPWPIYNNWQQLRGAGQWVELHNKLLPPLQAGVKLLHLQLQLNRHHSNKLHQWQVPLSLPSSPHLLPSWVPCHRHPSFLQCHLLASWDHLLPWAVSSITHNNGILSIYMT